ncbi:hypothetical protein LGM65_29170 [Burkholderia anthina]|uniref:hypothetical protein n=1 Tax=Burkholderia anthina TaxID=179879 RepID=UPI001CF2F277|nr:hypothetical protein [Burkholderia anthina]MCA8094896.1 hypothetical protein [Burkholderia anthina]
MTIGIRPGGGVRPFRVITSATHGVIRETVEVFHLPFNSGRTVPRRNGFARGSHRGPMFACIDGKESGN